MVFKSILWLLFHFSGSREGCSQQIFVELSSQRLGCGVHPEFDWLKLLVCFYTFKNCFIKIAGQSSISMLILNFEIIQLIYLYNLNLIKLTSKHKAIICALKNYNLNTGSNFSLEF